MHRRELLGAFGAAAGVWAVGAGAAVAADEPHHHHMDQVHEDCLKACGECAKVCNMMAHRCLDKITEGGSDVKTHARALSLSTDCQAFCVLSATMIARSSELMAQACEACAEACKCCAEACSSSSSDQAMKDCAAKCRECERTCREMVRHMKGAATR
jgi:hypothetical protein